MRVLMIGQLPKEVGGSYTTGVCNVVYELSRCMSQNVDLFIYATNLPVEKEKSISGCARYLGTEFRFFNVIWNIIRSPMKTIKQWNYYKQVTHLSPIRCEFYKDNFIRVIKTVKPDIIHCMNIFQMAPLFYANQGTGIPIVLTLHGVFFDNDKDVEDLTKGNVLLSDYVTGLTPETMKRIVEVLHFPAQKSFMVPNGADTKKFFYDARARSVLRKELGIEDDTSVLITVGSLQHRKGQLSFCEVLQKMPKDFKYKYLIIGKGNDKEKIEQYVADNGMQDKVQIIGYVPNSELFRYYSAADVYVHGSYEEGQALSEVEAYASGLKVAVNKGIIGTIVTDTENPIDYYIFEYNHFDAQSFIDWVNHKAIKRGTRDLVDWNRVFNMYIELYNNILS